MFKGDSKKFKEIAKIPGNNEKYKLIANIQGKSKKEGDGKNISKHFSFALQTSIVII
jgi:hypothetical protein